MIPVSNAVAALLFLFVFYFFVETGLISLLYANFVAEELGILVIQSVCASCTLSSKVFMTLGLGDHELQPMLGPCDGAIAPIPFQKHGRAW